MLCTTDLKVTKALPSSLPLPSVLVEGHIDTDMAAYFKKAKEVGFSTRSRYARLLTSFYRKEDQARPSVDEDGTVRTVLAYSCMGPEIVFAEGDGTARLYALKSDELVRGPDLQRLAGKRDNPWSIYEHARHPSTLAVEMQDLAVWPAVNRPIEAATLEKMTDISSLITAEPRTSWNLLSETVTLLYTKPVTLPDDCFGLIRGTSWQGNTQHINSTVIDPGWSGPILAEVNTRHDPANWHEPPRLLVQLYRATPTRSPSD